MSQIQTRLTSADVRRVARGASRHLSDVWPFPRARRPDDDASASPGLAIRSLLVTLVTGVKVTHTHVDGWDHKPDGGLRVLGPGHEVIAQYPAGMVLDFLARPGPQPGETLLSS